MRSTIGLGQGARFFLAAFQELGFDTRHADLAGVFYWHKNLALDLGREAQPGEGGVLVIHLNPRELPLALLVLGRGIIRHKRIIGHWTWELQGIPPEWKRGFRYVDEVWVPSSFVADAVHPHTDLPVRVVPYPVRCPVPSSLTREDFGLPERAFVCLTMFDMRSSVARKNPLAVIRAFRLAFGDDPSAVLVVKVGVASQAPSVMGELEREIAGASNIRFIFDHFESEDLAALLCCADVGASLHRSEGFGLMPAEAMLLGKPVIATGWSGNMDFMNKRNSALVDYKLVPVQDPQRIYTQRAQCWAEPDIEHAADWLRKLASSEELRRRLGDVAARDSAQFFSLESFRAAISDSASFSSGVARRRYSGTWLLPDISRERSETV